MWMEKRLLNWEEVYVPQSTEHKDTTNSSRGFHISSLSDTKTRRDSYLKINLCNFKE